MPDAPLQIAPNGSGSTPAAPPTVAAAAGGATPASPVQIAANGSGATPASPVQIAANGSGNTPSAPPQVAATAVGADGLTFATGTITITGAAGEQEIEILGTFHFLPGQSYFPGTTEALYAQELADLINAAHNEGDIPPSATVSGATVTVRAGLGGIIGNRINLTFSGEGMAVSGPFLSGGGGDSVIAVSGTLTSNGTTPVVFPDLAWNQTIGGEEREYSSTASGYTIGGPPLTGWHYTLMDSSVFTGVFPALVLAGYRWTLMAARYAADVVQEQVKWQSDILPDRHPAETATGWAAESPATGVPVLSGPTGAAAGLAAPPQVAANGGSSTPASPLQIAGSGAASTPAAPGQIAPNGSAATPAAPPAIV